MAASIGDLKRRAWRRTALFALAMAAMLFAPAGSLGFWHGWLYGFVFIAATAAIGAYFLKHDPELVERRMRAGPAAEQVPTQKVIISLIVFGFVLLVIVPGLDYQWQWSSVPPWLVLTADAAVVVSFVVMFVVLKQNSYAAATINVEVGQPVVSIGTYGIVRHPMYVGMLLLMIFTPLALGSYWTLLVLVPTIPVMVWRILDEERFLTRNLQGYAEYCRRVRYRLVPLVW